MRLDDLDTDLLEHFRRRFPRPESIPFCDYDIDPEEASALCRHPRPFEQPDLVRRFASHVRWGLFGSWREFPCFTADVCIWMRRHHPDFEHDLAFFLLHGMPGGAYTAEDRALLLRWCGDLLMPWQRPLPDRRSEWRLETPTLIEFGLLALLGGSPAEVLAADRAHGETDPIIRLDEARRAGLIDETDRLLPDEVRRRFEELARSHDNQQVPFPPLLPEPDQRRLIEDLAQHLCSLAEELYGS